MLSVMDKHTPVSPDSLINKCGNRGDASGTRKPSHRQQLGRDVLLSASLINSLDKLKRKHELNGMKWTPSFLDEGKNTNTKSADIHPDTATGEVEFQNENLEHHVQTKPKRDGTGTTRTKKMSTHRALSAGQSELSDSLVVSLNQLKKTRESIGMNWTPSFLDTTTCKEKDFTAKKKKENDVSSFYKVDDIAKDNFGKVLVNAIEKSRNSYLASMVQEAEKVKKSTSNSNETIANNSEEPSCHEVIDDISLASNSNIEEIEGEDIYDKIMGTSYESKKCSLPEMFNQCEIKDEHDDVDDYDDDATLAPSETLSLMLKEERQYGGDAQETYTLRKADSMPHFMQNYERKKFPSLRSNRKSTIDVHGSTLTMFNAIAKSKKKSTSFMIQSEYDSVVIGRRKSVDNRSVSFHDAASVISSIMNAPKAELRSTSSDL
jgi:hypothetical protein